MTTATPGYRPRIVDSELEARLGAVGAVVLEGPRACGKTATGRRHSASEVLFDVDPQARAAAEVDPGLVIEGAAPRLLDEWQLVPDVWNHVRRAVDDRGATGRFILAGSALPADQAMRHSGAGRISRLRMRTMSLLELGRSSGAVSLASLIEGLPVPTAFSPLQIGDLAEMIAVGGWPGRADMSSTAALRASRDYLVEVTRTDLPLADGVKRDPVRVGRLIQGLGRHVATPVALSTLALDAGGHDGALSRDTVRGYLGALERVMVLEDQPAWGAQLRSRSRTRGAPKRHFADPSLAVAALRGTVDGLLADMEMLGALFESLVVRDLRVYSQPIDGVVAHHRDSYGREVDAIVDAGRGRWAAFEVTLGAGRVDAAAAGLLRFARSVDHSRAGDPAALAVVTPSGHAYTRPDGVAVVPIGTLGP